MPTPQYISKITLPNGQVYNLKDEAAWSFMNSDFLKKVVQTLPDYTNMSTEELNEALHTIYLVPSTNPSVVGENVYEEYVLLQDTSTNPYSYSWELIGTTSTDLTNFSEKGHVHEVTPQTQVETHVFQVTGDLPTPEFTGTAGTVNATGTVSSGAVTINIANSSGSGTSYTPQGSLGGQTNTESAHRHSIGGTTKYLGKTTIYGVSSSGTSVQPAPTTSTTIEKVAQVADSQTSIQKYTVGSGSVTVTPATGNRADGTLKNLTNNVRTNAVFNDASVTDEVLSFTLKDLNVDSTVTGITSATTTANTVTANGTEDFYACKDGTGQTVHDYTYGSAVSVATVGDSVDVFTSVENSYSDTASQPIVTALDAQTGTGSAHSHNLGSNATFTGVEKKFRGTITDGSVSVSGTFTPSGTIGYEEGDDTFVSDYVQLAHNVNNPTVTSAPDVFDEESHLLDWYGVEWKVSSSDPHKTRIGNMDMHRSLPIQTGMRRCILDSYGNVYNYLDQYDSRYYAVGSKDEEDTDIGGTQADLDGAEGNVMVEIPSHWRSVNIVTKSDGDYIQVKISPYEQVGWKHIGKTYIGAYEGVVESGNTPVLLSISGEAPTTNKSLVEFRTAAGNNNPNSHYCIMTYLNWNELYWLYLVEYANTDYRETYNPQLTPLGFRQGGLGSFSISTANTGNSNAAGNRTYVDSAAGIRSYRGIENIFGHNKTLIDCVKVNSQTLSATIRRKNISTATYTNVSTSVPTSSGYISGIAIQYANGIFAPTAVAGGNHTYYCGYFNYASGNRCVVMDGLMEMDTSNLYDFSGAASIGSRLTFVRSIND